MFQPGAGLRHHRFRSGVVTGHVIGEADAQDVISDGHGAIDAGVAIDDVLDELALGFGLGIVLAVERGSQLAVGFEFVILQHEVLAGESVFEGVHAGAVFAFFCEGASGMGGVVAVDSGAGCGVHDG